jgi:hypothetical protein
MLDERGARVSVAMREPHELSAPLVGFIERALGPAAVRPASAAAFRADLIRAATEAGLYT